MGKNKKKMTDNTAGGVAPDSVVDEAPMSLGEDQQTAFVVPSSDATYVPKSSRGQFYAYIG
jgi:hypothetical protein